MSGSKMSPSHSVSSSEASVPKWDVLGLGLCPESDEIQEAAKWRWPSCTGGISLLLDALALQYWQKRSNSIARAGMLN
jgi:hypothetical protein